MTAKEIYDKILMQDDNQMLKNLPSEQRLACNKCKSVSIIKRASGQFYCPVCKENVDTTTETYYYKNKTVNPQIAVERHRAFWNRVYFEQLSRENFISPQT